VRVEGDDAAACVTRRPIELFYLAGHEIYHLDSTAAKDRALGVRAGIIYDPLAIRRPNSRVGENPPAGTAGKLVLGIACRVIE
jgi:hypothetical protein